MAEHRVLIVEDHAETRRSLHRIFRRWGWKVDDAATLAEGLVALAHEPDCIVLDLMLPDGGGEDLLRKARENEQKSPVVAVTTGLTDMARLAQVANLRPAVILVKPIDPEVVRRLCETETKEHPSAST